MQYSEEVVDSYVLRYATPNRLRHQPTDEDFARIHHGGPNGWNSPSTLEYWSKVFTAMKSGITGRVFPHCRDYHWLCYQVSTLPRVIHAFLHTHVVPKGMNTDRCNPSCHVRQCCDRNEEGDYECFCLQAKVNNPEEYVKRPCESMSFV